MKPVTRAGMLMAGSLPIVAWWDILRQLGAATRDTRQTTTERRHAVCDLKGRKRSGVAKPHGPAAELPRSGAVLATLVETVPR